jgi:hypothetical protein
MEEIAENQLARRSWSFWGEANKDELYLKGLLEVLEKEEKADILLLGASWLHGPSWRRSKSPANLRGETYTGLGGGPWPCSLSSSLGASSQPCLSLQHWKSHLFFLLTPSLLCAKEHIWGRHRQAG